MAEIYTFNVIKGLQENLSTICNSVVYNSNHGEIWNNYLEQYRKCKEHLEETDHQKYDDYFFQILTFDNDHTKAARKLVYGTKKDLEEHYGLCNPSFPTRGVSVNEDFISATPVDSIISEVETQQRNAVRAAVRFLLQSRHLSQLIAYTWLDKDTIKHTQELRKKKDRIKLVRKIFNSYNIKPNEEWLTPKPEGDDKMAYVIKPQYVSYNSISLALLLCGQAYYKNSCNQWVKIWEPIFSTYDMIWEYALDISWDTFYASRIDIAQATGQPQPPFTKVTLGYPPRPSEFDLKQKNIKTWAVADDTCDANYPFYPPAHSQEWIDKKLKFVQPPFPYIPLSSS